MTLLLPAGRDLFSPYLRPDAELATSGQALTLSVSAMVEDFIEVAGTFWTAYTRQTAGVVTIRLASTTDLAGNWTDQGQVLTLGSQTWENSAHGANGCCLLEQAGTFYIFYGSDPTGLGAGESADIGYASAPAVTGPYTKAAANPVLVRGGAGAWDELRVQEPSVIVVDGLWVMAYMGEAAGGTGLTEQCGIATATGPDGPWTKAAGNPVIPRPAGKITADPSLFHENGRWWCYYAEATAAATLAASLPWTQHLAWADDPLGPWTPHDENPILLPTGASFESGGVWRGGIGKVDNDYWLTYSGVTSTGDTSAAKGGTARLHVVGDRLPATPPPPSEGPPVTAGLVQRFDASVFESLVFGTGNEITQMLDLSGTATHAALDGTTAPTYDATGFNGGPVVNFVGAKLRSAELIVDTDDVTLFTVGTINVGRGMDGFGDGFSIRHRNQAAAGMQHVVLTSGTDTGYFVGPVGGTAVVGGMRIDQRVGDTLIDRWVHDAKYSINPAKTTLRSSTYGWLFGGVDGTLVETLVYNRALTDSEVFDVLDYLVGSH